MCSERQTGNKEHFLTFDNLKTQQKQLLKKFYCTPQVGLQKMYFKKTKEKASKTKQKRLDDKKVI